MRRPSKRNQSRLQDFRREIFLIQTIYYKREHAISSVITTQTKVMKLWVKARRQKKMYNTIQGFPRKLCMFLKMLRITRLPSQARNGRRRRHWSSENNRKFLIIESIHQVCLLYLTANFRVRLYAWLRIKYQVKKRAKLYLLVSLLVIPAENWLQFLFTISWHAGCSGKNVFFHNWLQPLSRLHRCKRPSKLSTQCEGTVLLTGNVL